MPHYPTNFNDPSLTMDNVATHREVRDVIDQTKENGTTSLTGSTDLLGDMVLALNELTAEISAFQSAIASGTLTAHKKSYLVALKSLKMHEIRRHALMMSWRLKPITAQVAEVDTIGVPTNPTFPTPTYPSSYNDYGTPGVS